MCSNKPNTSLKAVSLFSCIGVAECYLAQLGIRVVTASDIDEKRCRVHKFFYPDVETVCGDIVDDKTKAAIIKSAGGSADLVMCTPPCQGMSLVGKSKSIESLRHGIDERNLLILESFPVIDALSPSFVVFENIPRLLKVVFNYQGKPMNISDILKLKYGDRYEIKIDIFNTCNFGIPQNRERVFIRMFRKGLKWNDPLPVPGVVTLADAIGHLPALEPGENSGIKHHWARKHPSNQITWMRHTPTGASAFDNPVYYPQKSNGERVKGYHNCYKRLEWDKPSPTVTMRNEIISSQDKVHPGRPLGNGIWSDARVLTLRELLIVMSMPPDMDMPDFVSDTALRQYIGEGIPSLMMKKILEGIC